ncbi:MAG TPA: hypothetical protein VGY77_07695 [Gemmataceae bacterium]|nr:hypothetical protein [Gemmataceae bacterium]
MRNKGMCLLSTGFLCWVVGAFGQAQEANTPLKTGDFLPGPFQVLMITGERAGKFHCPVCEYDLRPAVLVFFPDVDLGPKLIGLLQKLDALIGKYPAARLTAGAVFMNDGDYRKLIQQSIDSSAKVKDLKLTSAINHKEEQEAKIKKLARDANLKNLTLGLGSHDDVAAYAADKNKITVLFYLKQRVVSIESFAKDNLTDQEMEKVLKTIDATCMELDQSARKR